MTKELIELITNFLFGDKSLYYSADPRLQELLQIYVQDKNSSTVREFITLNYIGIEKIDKKQGPDGFDVKRNKYVEVKPSYAHINKKTNRQSRLGAGGNFNDVTEQKLLDILGWDMVCSGFANNKCIYIIRFPVKHIVPHLQQELRKNISKNYVRPGTVSFGFKHFKDCGEWEILYLDPDHKQYLNRNFYKLIQEKLNDTPVP